MKKVFILVPEAAVPACVSGSKYLFTEANNILKEQGNPPLFDIKLVGESTYMGVHDESFYVVTDYTLHNSGNADLVIIPPTRGDIQSCLAINEKCLPWIIDQHDNGAEIASLCIGAFLLASTGLLDGKKCSTHWAFYDQFREQFPRVDIVDGAIITEQNGIYSSGGANSFWNLLLYILEKYTNRKLAIKASKYFAIDIDRESQSQFMIFQGQKDHSDTEIKKIQNFIESQFHRKITVEELASKVSISRRTFERRFKNATGNTAIHYLQRVKVEAAKRSLESSRKNISEVMYDVGYNDNKAFRSVFKKITGLTPIEYRNKFQKITN